MASPGSAVPVLAQSAAARTDTGGVVMEAEKRPAFFEGKFLIDARAALSAEDERLAVLSLLMMLLLERRRG